ncbi:MAG: carbamoyltransferase HypF, partial [Spirochaetales bacterium]|nr:carbamoyltransferase HypF [Spirochaetales bacterium]
KHREAKPFALMARDLETVRTFVRVNGEEEALLTGMRRPIVLLKRSSDPASSVAWGLDTLGVMLPCTPLQVLLFRYLKTPLIVATSGNLSEEPIVIDNREAFTRLGSVADAFLTYNRDIHNRCDDSIAMVVRKTVRLIRRSRGYVPEPVSLNRDAEGIAAFGAELKNTFCIGKGREALMSQHIGDLKSAETFDFFSESYQRFGRLFRFTPTLGACDLHPDYLSTAFCLEQGLPVTRVQHHHAHIAACMAENRAEGPVIGISFDGTGYGEDRAVWGGEFLFCDYASFTRYAHLQYVPLVGGDASVREPWRMALSWLYTCFGRDFFRRNIPFLRDLEDEKTDLFVTVLEKGTGSVPTSSAGRLFDALAAVLSLVKTSTFEAEGPMKLESIILPDDGVYPYRWGTSVDLTPLWEALLDDLSRGVPPGVISCRFHNTLAEVVFQGALRMAEETGVRQAALSGGVFQNRYLLARTEALLEEGGFTLLTHRMVPANDGGVSLGQLAVAAARREEGLEL